MLGELRDDAGDLSLGPVGAWATALLAGYLASVRALSRYERRKPWTAQTTAGATGREAEERPPGRQGADGRGSRRPSLAGLPLRTAAAAVLILAAGVLLSETGSAAAAKTGLGAAFFGATFVALATSLPEISIMVGAVPLRRYELAPGDIFGTNLSNAAPAFVIGAVAPGAPVLSRVGAFSAFGALLGLVLTTVFMAGVIERRDRTVLRPGWDSLAALLLYAAGLGVLWTLRGQTGG